MLISSSAYRPSRVNSSAARAMISGSWPKICKATAPRSLSSTLSSSLVARLSFGARRYPLALTISLTAIAQPISWQMTRKGISVTPAIGASTAPRFRKSKFIVTSRMVGALPQTPVRN